MKKGSALSSCFAGNGDGDSDRDLRPEKVQRGEIQMPISSRREIGELPAALSTYTKPDREGKSVMPAFKDEGEMTIPLKSPQEKKAIFVYWKVPERERGGATGRNEQSRYRIGGRSGSIFEARSSFWGSVR